MPGAISVRKANVIDLRGAPYDALVKLLEDLEDSGGTFIVHCAGTFTQSGFRLRGKLQEVATTFVTAPGLLSLLGTCSIALLYIGCQHRKTRQAPFTDSWTTSRVAWQTRKHLECHFLPLDHTGRRGTTDG